jgi:glycosyltransferase involved in cell wall biosynthesis
MNSANKPIRVLYSFPHKLGADRICYTAWQQVNGLAAAGAEVLCMPGVLHRPVPESVTVRPTLAWGKLRVSYKLLGTMRALALHDHIVARRLRKLVGEVDIVHTWPDAALETLQVAKDLGIPTVLERPNAHTRYAYESVQAESRRLGIVLPSDDEYAYKADVLEKEEREYALADFILCPSEFTVKTFVDQGIPREKLLRHQYGYDEKRFRPDPTYPDPKRGLTMLFAGVAAVRKGLHFALAAWIKSTASKGGKFLIAGTMLPEYAEKMKDMLSHPSVQILGHRNDLPDLMRKCDVFTLPSIEEGFGLVIVEAMGSGCVPLISEACTDVCRHMQQGLVHKIGDVAAIQQHITMLHEDRQLLAKLRAASLDAAPKLTWTAAGVKLVEAYQEAIASYRVRDLQAATV